MKITAIIFLMLLSCLVFSQDTLKTFNYTDTFFEVGAIKIIREITFWDGRFKFEKTKTEIALDSLSNFLKKNLGLKIEIGFYTDYRGSERYNQMLTQRYAEGVKDYLVRKNEIDTNRIKAIGYGETKLIMPEGEILKIETKEEQEDAHALNRRGEIKIIAIE